MIKKLYLVFFLTLVLPVQVTGASKSSLQAQRKIFDLAEKSIKKNDDKAFARHIKGLKKYPLFPYLQYQWLLKNMHKTKKVNAFLTDYANTRYAGSLKYRRLVYLAKNKHWNTFIKHYKKTSDPTLQCYYSRAKYNTGRKKQALLAAKKLWVVGKSQPSECDPVFRHLKASSYFTRDMLWQRFAAALAKGNTRLARYVNRSMTKKDQAIAKLWLKVHSNPQRLGDKKLLKKNHHKAGFIFIHGIKRLARTDTNKAVSIWDARKNEFKISKSTKQRVEQKLALALAVDGDKTAYRRLNQLKNLNKVAKEWRVRVALRDQNWQQVKQSIAKLDKSNQKQDKWTYWLARALENKGEQKEADLFYNMLSKNRSYYGYLSANKLNKEYKLSDNPIQISNNDLKKIKQKTDFRVVAEFIKVDKLDEARKQWWYAVSKLNKEEILAAAKYAQQLQWNQIAISTVAKVKYWDDVELRFPFDFKEQVKNNSKLQKLSPAVIFGLIRRESAFNQEAVSPVGARGLMQIMPRTGRQIAKELKEKRYRKADLFDPAKNIKYGSFYYKQLLDQFNGHYALAAAAYNAGPHRVKRWIPENKKISADIWVETIPFKETRAYVSAVLTYALIYQKKMNANTLSMNDFMRDVEPG